MFWAGAGAVIGGIILVYMHKMIQSYDIFPYSCNPSEYSLCWYMSSPHIDGSVQDCSFSIAAV